MERREFLRAASSMLVFAMPVATSAQAVATVRRIGYLGTGVQPSPDELKQYYAPLRELGWIEGQNLVFERRYANGKGELQSFAAELVRLNVEIIVTGGTDATLAAKGATKSIPIVMRSAGDPVRTGLVESLARPDGNVTGYSIVGVELDSKRIALLRELLPTLQRLGWLETPNSYYRAVREDLEKACRSVGINPIFVEVAAVHELETAIAAVAGRGGQALMVPTDGPFYENRVAIMRASLKHALPTMVDQKTMLEAGALVSYAESQAELWRRVAAYIDKILRGAKPADLPVEQPTKFELGINLKTAKALGINISPSVLSRADEVVQ